MPDHRGILEYGSVRLEIQLMHHNKNRLKSRSQMLYVSKPVIQNANNIAGKVYIIIKPAFQVLLSQIPSYLRKRLCEDLK